MPTGTIIQMRREGKAAPPPKKAPQDVRGRRGNPTGDKKRKSPRKEEKKKEPEKKKEAVKPILTYFPCAFKSRGPKTHYGRCWS